MFVAPAYWFTAAIVTAALGGAALRAIAWNRGRRSSESIELLSAPRRYLRDVHDVVARDRLSAWMHGLVAGGFVASVPLVAIVHGVSSPRSFAWLLLCAIAAMGAGVVLMVLRRRALRAQLSAGAYLRIAPSLAAFAAFCGYATLPHAQLIAPVDWLLPWNAVALAVGALATCDLMVAFAAGPLKHATSGFLHLAGHPRPERFRSGSPGSAPTGPAAALARIDLAAPKLGVEVGADFSAAQLRSFDACIECGRCEAACPAYAAGQPLNPKALIQTLARSAIAPPTFEYRGHPHPGLAPSPRVAIDEPMVGESAAIAVDTIWACTTCRACVYECPMLIEHVDAVMDLRRFQVLELGAAPKAGARVLRQLRRTDDAHGRPAQERLEWCNDLNVRVLGEEDEGCDTLLWVSTSADEPRGQSTLRAFVRLLRLAKVDFAILGEREKDCGDLARRLGDEIAFERLARENIATLQAVRPRQIVTADPHALNCIKNEYPAFGAAFVVRHHTELLNELMEQGALAAPAGFQLNATYHDPCYLARYNGITDAPRELLARIGVSVVEMPRSGMRTRCCGGGGGAPLADVRGSRRPADIRMDEARATGANTLIVACPGCMSMFNGASGDTSQVRDVAEVILEAIAG